jgi:uncharacterized damage-inducible protein DinB
MNYYGGKELAEAFRTVRKNTIQIAEEIPEDKYDFKASPESRTIAQTLAHLAVAPQFQLHVHANKVTDMKTVNFGELFQRFGAAETQARSKAELIAYLKEEGDKFASFLETVDEAFLAERVSLPPGAQPPDKTRFEMMLGAKEHEMHHRGQLMLIERMLGQVPHLTRQMQERMAAMQTAAAAAAGQPAAAGQAAR